MDVRMDLDGLVAFDGDFPFLFSENEMTKHGFDSSLPKQSVSGFVDDECRIFKMARTDDLLTSKTMLQKETLPLIRSNSFVPEREQSQPLSFSFPRAQSMLKKEEPFQRILYDASLSNFQSPSSTLRTTGLSSKSTKMNVQGVLTGIKGPFTPSQWMELELQALIYKYLNTNTPIPSNLLAFIRKTFYPYTYSGSTIVSTKPNTLGWGSFHLGFPGTLDSEPGRCRRTDGKKWRCSRDAVSEQKYCERHLNRGRHRSRKSVEGQTCVAFSGSSMSGPRQINSYPVTESTKNSITEFRTKNLQTDIGSFADRKLESKSNVDHEDSRRSISFPCSVNSEDPDKDMQLLGETTEIDYTLIANDPTQNSQKGFDSSVNINDQEQKTNAFRFFLDDHQKIQFDRNVTNWFDVEDIRTDKTQPSISIPAGFDFSPSSPRPIQEKLNPAQKFTSMQENSFPISWENAMGGPLGEVLKHSKNSSPWDSRSRLDSSPSGVLATFGSLSNSSADSIPIQAHGIT